MVSTDLKTVNHKERRCFALNFKEDVGHCALSKERLHCKKGSLTACLSLYVHVHRHPIITHTNTWLHCQDYTVINGKKQNFVADASVAQGVRDL